MTVILSSSVRRATRPGRSIDARKLRQTISSIPHYAFELSRIRSADALADWVYYKAPNAFSLRDWPVVLNLEITNECNFACPHCPRDDLNIGRDIGMMDTRMFDRIIYEIAGHVPVVKLIGLGEPALHPQLDALMHRLRLAGLRTLIYTNGTLFERFTPEDIFAWEVSQIVVSVDGLDERGFERLRVGGHYQNLLDNLETFQARRAARAYGGPPVEVRHVIMPGETPAMLAAFKRAWRGRHADTVKFNLLVAPYGRPRGAVEQRPSCRDIRREMHVRVDGRVPLCGYEGHAEWIGDLRTSTVSRVWRAARLEEVRRLHATRDLTDLPFCKTCQFW